MYFALCLFRACNRPHEFPVKFDWLTFTAWHKITSLLTGIKETKEQQATREVKYQEFFFSSSPVRRKKNTKKRARSQVKRSSPIFLFRFSIRLLHLSLPFIISKVEKISVWFLNWHAEENYVVNNKENRFLMSRNYRSDSCPLEIRCKLRFSGRHLF